MAKSDFDAAAETHRKIFIGGLSLTTTDDMLREFYSQWGEIIDCIVMKDNTTKKSRGFGFITYQDSQSVDVAMKSRPHHIDGRDVDPKRAVPRGDAAKSEMFVTCNKVYVGGLKEGVPLESEDIRDYFQQFGNVTECEIKYDNEGKKRGYGFVTFDDYDSVDKIVLHKTHTIKDIRLPVNKAMTKDEKAKIEAKQTNLSRNQPRNYPSSQYDGGFNDPNMYNGFDYNFQNMMYGGNGFGGMPNNMNPMMNPMMGMGGMNDYMGAGGNMPMMSGFDGMGYGNNGFQGNSSGGGGGPMKNNRNNMIRGGKGGNAPYSRGGMGGGGRGRGQNRGGRRNN